jgi:hypothetical protein
VAAVRGICRREFPSTHGDGRLPGTAAIIREEVTLIWYRRAPVKNEILQTVVVRETTGGAAPEALQTRRAGLALP